jgi:hypothetical protein
MMSRRKELQASGCPLPGSYMKPCLILPTHWGNTCAVLFIRESPLSLGAQVFMGGGKSHSLAVPRGLSYSEVSKDPVPEINPGPHSDEHTSQAEDSRG